MTLIFVVSRYTYNSHTMANATIINSNIRKLLGENEELIIKNQYSKVFFNLSYIYISGYILYYLSQYVFIMLSIHRYVFIEFLNSALMGKYSLELSLILIGVVAFYGLMYLLNDLDEKLDLKLFLLKDRISEKDKEIKILTFELKQKKKTIAQLTSQLKQYVITPDEEPILFE